MQTEVLGELEIIRKKAGGFLRPTDVVKYAKSEKSALHSYFEWDNGKAAEKWRLRQASELIRVVVIVSEQTSEKVRAFVSLTQDRTKTGGYRAFADVVENEQLFANLLSQARNELVAFKRKYDHLRQIGELIGVFEAIESETKSVEENRVSA